MDEVTIGPNGRVTIPSRILRELGIDGACVLEASSADGAIVLRPVSAAQVEDYDDERIAAFLAEDELYEGLSDLLAARFDAPREGSRAPRDPLGAVHDA